MQFNKVKDVNAKKFDALRKKHINTSYCPRCDSLSTEIVIDTSAYGKWSNRAFVRCKTCGYITKTYDAMTTVDDVENKRFGNFLLEKSLMGAIRKAINHWNGRSENGKS